MMPRNFVRLISELAIVLGSKGKSIDVRHPFLVDQIRRLSLTLNFDLLYHQYVRPNCFVKLFDITSPDFGLANLLLKTDILLDALVAVSRSTNAWSH